MFYPATAIMALAALASAETSGAFNYRQNGADWGTINNGEWSLCG